MLDDRSLSLLLIGLCACSAPRVAALHPGTAGVQQAPADTGPSDTGPEAAGPSARTAEEVAADLANPLAPITTLFVQHRSEFGVGPDDDRNQQVRLSPSFFQAREDGSAFLLRSILPFPIREWPVEESGIGDLSLIPYYVPDIQRSVFVGYGLALGIPTASEDSLGSGRWTAGPALLVAKTGDPLTYGGLVQHVESFAGDEDRADVRVTTVQPFATYLLGDGWSTSVLSEPTYDWEREDWTIPVNLGVSRVVEIGGRFFNIGVTTVHYLDGPDFAPDWELRLNLTYVFR